MRKAQERQDKLEGFQHTNTADKPKERLSERDLRELMNVNRDTYKRVHGAVRKR